jgi:hypothetical protein
MVGRAWRSKTAHIIAARKQRDAFFPFIPSGSQPMGVLPTVRAGLTSLVNLLCKHPYRQTQRYALPISQGLLNPIKLTIKLTISVLG